ncbi:MAG: hypothetical protein H6815_07685 [Phycisphaeraceae bacterium]|nr:hypothetical protein [Phycisphaerales bacterium]MCB9860322.1 hypothetical protein [Phycisphaeraceae bacterium]
MQHRRAVRTNTTFIGASIVAMLAVAGLPLDLFAQENVQPDSARTLASGAVATPAMNASTAPSETPDDPTIEFNLDGAPLSQVLHYFERETGLPIIYETTVPDAKMTFKSPQKYTLRQALNIVNLNMNQHNVYLRVEDGYLYFEDIAQAFRKVHQVYQTTLPDSVLDSEIVTLTIPLQNSVAAKVVEQIKPLINEKYGMAHSVEAQNFVVITETAGQVRRIQKIIEPIDAAPPVDSEFRVFKLKHTRPELMIETLSGLVGQKTVGYFVDAKGNKTQFEENTVPGVTMEVSRSLNAVICVGPSSRLDSIQELIDVLDVPAVDGADDASIAQARSFQLSFADANDVAKQLNNLYSNVKKEDKPSVVALSDVNKVIVSGNQVMIAKAEALIRAIEPEAVGSPEAATGASVQQVVLQFADAAQVSRNLNDLMSPTQKRLVRVSAANGSPVLVVSGTPTEVETVASMARAFDVPAQGPGQIRQVEISDGDITTILEQSGQLFEMSGNAERGSVQTLHMPGSRVVTLIGDPESVQAFENAIKSAQRLLPPKLTTKLIDVRNTDPESLIVQLRDMIAAASESDEFLNRPEPGLSFYGPTSTLIVKADTDQHRLIADFVRKLDVIEQGKVLPINFLSLKTANVTQIADLLNDQYSKRPQKDRLALPVDIRADVANNTLIVSAHPDIYPEIKAFVDDLNREKLDGPERMTFTIKLTQARAEDVAVAMNKLYPEPPMPRDRRGQPMPWAQEPREVIVSAEPRMNLLLIEAPAEREASIRELAATFDSMDTSPDAETHIFAVDSSEIDAVVRTLQQLSTSGGLGSTGRTQVTIIGQPRSNSIVISGPSNIFPRVEEVLQTLASTTEKPEPVLHTYKLDHARADRLGPTLEGLLRVQLAQHKVARGVPANELAGLLSITTEQMTNTLIIAAPEPIHEIAIDLLNVLDSEAADVGRNTTQIVQMQFGDVNQTAARLNELVRADALNISQPVQVFPIAGSKSVMIVGAEKDVASVAGMVSSLDVRPVDLNETQARTFLLKHARAESISPVIESALTQESMIDKLPQWDRGWFLRNNPDAGKVGVRVTSDARTNSIVVTAPLPMLDLAEQIMRDLDVPSTTGMAAESRPVRVLSLTNADAKEFAASIEAVFAEEIGKDQPPTVRVNSESNSLIIRATTAQMRTIEELAARVDSASIGSGREMRTISIDPSKARASDIADTIRKLMRQQSGATVEVISFDDLLKEDEPKPGSWLDGSDVFDIDELGPNWMALLSAQAISMVGIAPDITDQLVLTSPQPDEVKSWFPTTTPSADPDGTPSDVSQPEDTGAPDSNLSDPDVTIAVDPATNSLVVVGSPRAAERIAKIIDQLQSQMPSEAMRVRVVTLPPETDVDAIGRIVTDTVRNVGKHSAQNPGGFTSNVRVTSAPTGNALIVWSNDTDFATVGKLIGSVAKLDSTNEFPVRTVKLEQADARATAQALTNFFRDRSRAMGERGNRPTAAIFGDERSGTLIVSASDEDYASITSMIETLDQPQDSQKLQIEILPIKHVKAKDLSSTLDEIYYQIDNARWSRSYSARNSSRSVYDELVIVEVNEAANSVILIGQGETMDMLKDLVSSLDVPSDRQTQKTARVVKVEGVDLNAIAQIVRDMFQETDRGAWWWSQTYAVNVTVDRMRSSLILVGDKIDVDKAVSIVEELSANTTPDLAYETIKLEHAEADRAAQSLNRFFADRSRALGLSQADVTIIGSREGNVLIVSANESNMALLNDLLAHIDQPDLGEDRKVEIYNIRNADIREMSDTVRNMFPTNNRPDEKILVMPQPSRGLLIVSAPTDKQAEIGALISSLDTFDKEESSRFVTVALKNVSATQAANALRDTVGSSMKISITPIDDNNTLAISGSEEAVAAVMEQIETLDVEFVPVQREFRRVKLVYQRAVDVYFLVSKIARSGKRSPDTPAPDIDYSTDDNSINFVAVPAEVDFIMSIIKELDVPNSEGRRTDWLKLQYANAEQAAKVLEVFYGRYAIEAKSVADRDVSIRADAITNSLIVSANEEQWGDIHALIERIDTEEYDTERQLGVIALKHADAQAVAEALNTGLQAPMQARLAQEQIRNQQRNNRNNNNRNTNDSASDPDIPTLAIADDDVPSVSAERRTNSLIVFATPKQLVRIEAIVEDLDQPMDKASGEARLILVHSGQASNIARTVNEVYVNTLPRGTRPVVFGDDNAGVLIVRSDDSDFARIKTLAESLQQTTGDRAGFEVIKLTHVPAAKIQRTVERLFEPAARKTGEALVIEVDRTNNALVVSAGSGLVQQIREIVEELDANPNAIDIESSSGLLGSDLTIVELQHVGPEQMIQMLRSLGLMQQNQNNNSLVGEPVRVTRLESRSAIVISGAPADVRIVVDLAKSFDAERVSETQHAAIIAVKNNNAQNIVRTLNELIRSATGNGQPSIADALAEQVRRRLIATEDGEQPKIGLDLTEPIQLIADNNTNRVIVASSEENVIALRVLVESLDVMPVGNAVVVRIIPLSNAAPQQIQQVINGLFQRGRALTNQKGSNRAADATTVTGQVLSGEIAMEIDQRTNALIIAGSEEAVSFVEMMVERLDRDEMGGWVEPRIIKLEYADAGRIEQILQRALMTPSRLAMDEMGLRQQFARIRIAQSSGENNGNGRVTMESDLYAPVSSLFISADRSLNSLVVVASPSNLKIVEELIKSLDVPSAAIANNVRFFPLEHAVADRIAQMVNQVFRERERVGDIRPEDRVVITTDARTNSLMVWTSATSMELVRSLVERLDTEQERLAVGMHVLPVPDFDVADLAQQIERVMRATIDAATRNGEVRTAADIFTVQADPSNDLLILTCSDDNLQAVEDLIEKMRMGKGPVESDMERPPEIIHIASGFVDDIAENIDRLYVQPETERRGENAVTVIPDTRLSALIVRGTDADVAAIRRLVDSLDKPETTGVRVMQRIELRYSNAREVADYVGDLLTGRNNVTRSAETLRLVVKDNDSNAERTIEAQIDDQIRSQIEITPEERSNSVTVVAPESIMDFIRLIIEDQEASDNADRSVKHFVLKNASAPAMARVLRDLFDLREVGTNLILVPSPRNQNDANSGDVQLQPAADDRQKLSITVDERTNSLLVSGTKEYLEKVEEVITQLESIDVAQRYRLVYQLRNSQAEDIEQALRDYFGAEQQATLSTTSPDALGSLQAKLEYEVTIVGDEKSNTVLVAASPRQIEVVEQIIRELDTAPPQVRIEVLIAEVTLDNGESWGVDLTLKNIGGDDFQFSETAAGLGLTAAVGAGNLALASSDIDLMVRALEGRGKLRVLSRPQIAVTNNEEGVFKVVEEVSLLTGFETLDSGRTRAQVSREEVGVTLRVTPTINADGFVRMDIQPEISALTDSRSQISEEFVSENFAKRELDTVVTIRNGQTAVIGGIIQSNEEERQTQVPFFGDLPVVGWVFKTNKVSNVRTELLMLLTPRIIPSDSSGSVRIFNEITGEEINRMTDPMPIRRQLPGFGPGTENDLQPILQDAPKGSTSYVYPSDPAFGRAPARYITNMKEAQ